MARRQILTDSAIPGDTRKLGNQSSNTAASGAAAMFERAEGGERALLIQPRLQHPRHRAFDPAASDVDGDLAEFKELVRSAGAQVVSVVPAPLRRPDPATLLGAGKLDEVRALLAGDAADLVIVNHDLSAGQERNLERKLECRVVDRIGLILDIFAQRASTAEGKLQVELAQLRHLSTRLVRGWTHLERQKGGIGLRGPGETQLETDRRLLGERIRIIRQRLARVQTHRDLGRRARDRAATPLVSLIGYTNAGKSTLFNSLTGADVHAADQLFATLDPTVRRVELPGPVPVVIADTVGFIRDLPHELIAAFRATLEETRRAALLLHVVDATDRDADAKRAQVSAVLEQVGASDVPQLEVVNKIDALPSHEGGFLAAVPAPLERDAHGEVSRVRVSALTGEGLESLRNAMAERFAGALRNIEIELPLKEGRLHAELHDLRSVASERVTEEAWQMSLQLRPGSYQRLCRRDGLDGFVVARPAEPYYDGRPGDAGAVSAS